MIDTPPDAVEPIELLILIFNTVNTADEALNQLKNLPKEEREAIINLAVISKDEQGNTTVKEIDDVSPRQGTWFGAVTGGLLGLLAGPVGAVVGAAAGAATGRMAAKALDLGFSNKDLENLQNGLQPGNSALMMLVKFESAENMLAALANLQGQLLQETLTEEMLLKLMRRQEPPDNQ